MAVKAESGRRRLMSRRRVLTGAGAVLAAAYPATAATRTPAADSFARVVRRRRMIRAYTDEPVAEGQVLRLLRYAVRAPSAGNLQPWEFVVVREAQVRAELAKAAFEQQSVATAPVIIATCANVRRAGRKYGARGAFYSLVDTSFATLLLLLAATEQGLGACFVGSYDPIAVSRTLGLPEHMRPVGLVTLGHPAEHARKPGTPHIPLRELVHHDRW